MRVILCFIIHLSLDLEGTRLSFWGSVDDFIWFQILTPWGIIRCKWKHISREEIYVHLNVENSLKWRKLSLLLQMLNFQKKTVKTYIERETGFFKLNERYLWIRKSFPKRSKIVVNIQNLCLPWARKFTLGKEFMWNLNPKTSFFYHIKPIFGLFVRWGRFFQN